MDNFKGLEIRQKKNRGTHSWEMMSYLGQPLSLPRGDTGFKRGLMTLSLA